MRVLLDECVPRSLRRQLPGHEVSTVAESGWIAVVIVHAPSNDVSVLRPLMPQVLQALAEAAPGKVTHVRG